MARRCPVGFRFAPRFQQCVPTKRQNQVPMLYPDMNNQLPPFGSNFQYTPNYVSASNPTPAPLQYIYPQPPAGQYQTPIQYLQPWQYQQAPAQPPVIPFEARPYQQPAFDNTAAEMEAAFGYNEGSTYDGMMGLGEGAQTKSTIDRIRESRDLALETWQKVNELRGKRGMPPLPPPQPEESGLSKGLIYGGLALLAVVGVMKLRKK